MDWWSPLPRVDDVTVLHGCRHIQMGAANNHSVPVVLHFMLHDIVVIKRCYHAQSGVAVFSLVYAALLSSILYGCESWLGASLRSIEPAYRTLVRVLLGVRPNTAIDLCLLELRMSSLGARVKAAQKKFVLRLLSQRESIIDDPFMVIWKICVTARTKGAKYLKHVCW